MLLRGFLPLWFVPGLLDYAYHRRAHIEETSGTHESVVHATMMLSVAAPITYALFFEVDPFALTLAAATALAHELLAIWDVGYASGLRETPPGEQHVHAFLETMPFAGAAMLAASHPEALRDLRRAPSRAVRPEFARKRRPVSPRYLGTFFTAVVALIALPYGEELVRCYRRDRTLAPRAKPEG